MATWAELRRKVASLFGSAVVHCASDDDLYLRSHAHSFDPATRWRKPIFGDVDPLLRSHECPGSGHNRHHAGSLLHIAAGESLGPEAHGGRIAIPPVGSAHLHAIRPVDVALVAHPANRPLVIQPSIARPSRPTVLRLVAERTARPNVRAASPTVVARGTVPVFAALQEITPTKARLYSVPTSIALQAPMERRRLPMPSRGSARDGFVYQEEHKALASANGLAQEDIRLVGVYLNVPLGAASQMEFDETTGSLLLALRENASEQIGRMQRPVVTLALGKVIATGKVVRAFL